MAGAATTRGARRPIPGLRLLPPGLVAALAVGALAVARAHQGGSFAGGSVAGGTIELAAAFSLAAAAALASHTRGALLAGAGAAWLLAEGSNPEIGSSVAFTLGLIGAFAPAPLIAALALRRSVATVAAGVGVLAVGAVPALVFDPQAQGCLTCPPNLVSVHGDASAYSDLSVWGIRVAIVCMAFAIGSIALRAARVARGPLPVAAAAYLTAVVADLWHSEPRGVLSNDPTDVLLWKLQGVALVLVAAAAARDVLRARRIRTAMAALVVELGSAPRIGGARDKLAEALGDSTVQLAYRRTAQPGHVRIDGEPLTLSGQGATAVVRDEQEIALVLHDARLLREPALVEGAIAAARLAVENEQLQAELSAQAREIRGSRARIVHESDRARRGLERDLHDGAQQRLVSLSLAIRLLHGRARGDATRARLDDADAQLRGALAGLRDLAHGIYPASLGDDGLAAALEELAERSGVRISVVLPEERLPETIEEAAYFVVAEIVSSGQPAHVTLDGPLTIHARCSAPLERLTEIADRVGALDGSVETATTASGVDLRASIPCA